MSAVSSSVQIHSEMESTINEIILKGMFGSDYNNVNRIIETLIALPSNELNNYELEIRFGDNNIHTTPEQWRAFTDEYSDKLTRVLYSDYVIANYKSPVDVRNLYLRHNTTIDTFEEKLVIFKTVQAGNSLYAPTLKLSKEYPLSIIDTTNDIIDIVRQQRCSYRFNPEHFKYEDPDNLLSNWRIDMTLRLFSTAFGSSKNTIKLDESNMHSLEYYDSLDIEIEFVGSYQLLRQSIFKLAEVVFKVHSQEQIIFDMIYRDMIGQDSILEFGNKQLIMSSNDINNLNSADYAISNENPGDMCYIITITHAKSHKLLYIYAMLKNEIRHLWYAAREEYALACISQPSNFDYSCYQAIYDGMYTIIDIFIHNSTPVNTIKFELRMNIINASITLMNACVKMFKKLQLTTYNSWDDVIHSIQSTKSITLKSKTLDASKETIYIMPGSKNLNINFKLHYVPIKGVYYLYVHGCVSQILRSLTILNRYSVEHTGYALVGTNPSLYYDVLFDSPFLENAFYYEPSLYDTDIEYNKELVRQMIANPMSFDGSIVKMVYNNHKWFPLKISKSRASTYVESIKISSLIKNYYDVCSNITFSNAQVGISDLFNRLTDTIDKFIYERVLNKYSNESFIDYISDGSYNAKYTKNIANAVSIYVVSDNMSIMDKYISELMFAQPVSPTFVERHSPRPDTAFINVNVLHCTFKTISSSISRTPSYTPGSICTIFCQALFNMFESLIDIIVFRDTCISLLHTNGALLMKMYDESTIRSILHNNTTSLSISHAVIKAPVSTSEAKITFEAIYELHTGSVPKSKPSITSTDDNIRIAYNGWKCSCPKPFDAPTLKHAGLLCLYYAHNNMYNDGTFVTKKLLTKAQTVNLKYILGLDTEYSTNAYDRTLDHWYSEHNCVDCMVGSSGDVSECNIAMHNILIELDTIHDDVLHSINSLKHAQHNIAIATSNDIALSINHQRFMLENGVLLYVIFADNISCIDTNILSEYIRKYVAQQTTEIIFEYYTHPIIKSHGAKLRLSYIDNLICGDWFNTIMAAKFSINSIEQPMSDNAIVKYCAMNKSFTNVSSIEDFFKAVMFTEYRPL